MKEAIKSYHMFLPRTWLKWCIYIVYPVAVIGMIYLLRRGATFFSVVCIGLYCFAIVAVEMMLDTYMFLGIAARDTNRLEYLKTSVKGLLLLKKALAADAIRRFFSAALIMAGVYLVIANNSIGDGGITALQCGICVVVTCFLTELGFLLTRLFMNVWLNLALVYVLSGIASVAGIYAGGCKGLILPLVIAVILYVIIAVTGRVLILKRARESYYDR
ncbi:MAG: hypothetical protein K2K56_04330 [Lachnospiraceae bacterium]|nr:hypothetical protein [Lachnospiraceae bacterium]